MPQRAKPTAGVYIVAVIIALIAFIMGILIVGNLATTYFFTFRDPTDRAPLIVVLVVLALGGYLVYRNVLRIASRIVIPRGKRIEIPPELIVPCLAANDYPCPRCAYNLKGLQQPACPECNEPVRLAMIDYSARTPGQGFGFVLAWLLLSTFGTLLISAYAIKAIFQMYSMMYAMAGAFGPGIGVSSYLISYIGYALVPVVSFVVCAARLFFLFFAKGDRGNTWTRSTVLALSIVTVGWTLIFTVIAAFGLLR